MSGMWRVAVVGGGIGGLAAAIAMRRAGLAVEVYEQADHLGAAGIGMHVGPNASRLLHRWGLLAPLTAVATRPVALEVRHWQDGRVFARQEMGSAWEAQFGAPYYTLSRSDLHRILVEQVPAEHIHLGRRLAGFTEYSGGVQLDFADGGGAHADILIGADGIHSVVRSAVAGPDEAVLSRSSALRGLARLDRLPTVPRDTMFLWAGPQARLLCYPVDAGRRLTVVAVVPDAGSTVESWDSPATHPELVAAFADWDPTVRAIVGAVEGVRRWTLYDREPLPAWSTDRVTLLGDAAHPMLPHHGQGANQAIEDAAALAICLAQAWAATDGTAVALRRYESVRRAHTARVQLGSRASGSLRIRPPEHAGRSNGALPSLVEDVSWVMRHDVEQTLALIP